MNACCNGSSPLSSLSRSRVTLRPCKRVAVTCDVQVPLSAAHPVAPPAAVTLVASTPLWGCNHAGKWLARTFKLIQKRPTSRRKTDSSKACNFDRLEIHGHGHFILERRGAARVWEVHIGEGEQQELNRANFSLLNHISYW